MIHQGMSLAELRDAAAVAIARALVDGRPVSDDARADFAELDSLAGNSWHDEGGTAPGAAFGIFR